MFGSKWAVGKRTLSLFLAGAMFAMATPVGAVAASNISSPVPGISAQAWNAMSASARYKVFMNYVNQSHIQEQRDIKNAILGNKSETSSGTKSGGKIGITVNSTGYFDGGAQWVGSGYTSFSSNDYFNNGTGGNGLGGNDAWWDKSSGGYFAEADVDYAYGNEYAWALAGNMINYEPNAPKGTLVPVTVTFNGLIDAEADTYNGGGDTSGSVGLTAQIWDVTTGQEIASQQFDTVNAPFEFWNSEDTIYSETLSANLTAGDYFKLIVENNASAYAWGSAGIQCFADPAWSSGTGAWLNSTDIQSN